MKKKNDLAQAMRTKRTEIQREQILRTGIDNCGREKRGKQKGKTWPAKSGRGFPAQGQASKSTRKTE